MGELTASLAHEVNQPIAAAVTNANTCLRWLARDHPDVEEARRGRHENRERWNACSRNRQANPPALQEEYSATGAGGRKRSHSRDDRALAQRGNAIQHNGPDGASRRPSRNHWRSGAIATGSDEPHREQHRDA